MKQRHRVTQLASPRMLTCILFTAVAGIASSYAVAQSPAADAQERYRLDVERCRSGQTSQDTQTCLREAGAALEEARRNRLVTGTPSFETNQRARCESLTGTEREDCLHLMSDPAATTQGSVAGGGILRESTITIPADSTTPGTAPSTYGGGLAPSAPSPYAPAPSAGNDGLAPASVPVQ